MKLPPDPPEPGPEPGRLQRFQLSVRMLIVLVACSAATVWMTRPLWDPVLIAVAGLRDPSPWERADALHSLSRIGRGRYETVIPPVILALVDLEPSVRCAAAEALASLGSDAWAAGSSDRLISDVATALLGALKDPETSVRQAAANSLGTIVALKGVASVIDRDAVLREVAGAFGEPPVGARAGPGRIDSDPVMTAFRMILADPGDERRPAVLRALTTSHVAGRFAPPGELIAILEENSPADRAAAVRALGGFDCALDPWIPTLFRLLESDEPSVQSACALVLDRIAPPAASADSMVVLFDALHHTNSSVRLHAARALRLAPMQKPHAIDVVPTLIAVLRKNLLEIARQGQPRSGPRAVDAAAAVEVADHMVCLLGEVAPDSDSAGVAVAVLAEAVRCGVPNLRQSASYALSKFDRAAQAALIALLNDHQPRVRLAAAESLNSMLWQAQRNLDSRTVFAALADRLDDDNADVRIAVLKALGEASRGLQIEPPPAFAACLADKSAPVRTAAVDALAHFACGLDRWIPSIFQIVEREPDDHVSDVERALRQVRAQPFSAPAVSALIIALGSQHRAGRCLAARLLGTLGPDAVSAVPALVKGLAYPFDAKIAGLGKLDSPTDFDPGGAVVEALSRIAPGTPAGGEAVRALIEVARDEHSRLAGRAIVALGRFGAEAVSAAPVLVGIIKENVQPGKPFGYQAVAAATALAEIAPEGPAADEAIALLTDAMESVSWDIRGYAVDALAAFGPRAKNALARLRALRTCPDPTIRVAVDKAIGAIDFDPK